MVVVCIKAEFLLFRMLLELVVLAVSEVEFVLVIHCPMTQSCTIVLILKGNPLVVVCLVSVVIVLWRLNISLVFVAVVALMLLMRVILKLAGRIIVVVIVFLGEANLVAATFIAFISIVILVLVLR